MFKTPGDLPKPTNAEERLNITLMGSKQISDLKNPCIKEQKLSYKCLDENNYDKEICKDVFINYRNCQKFWDQIRLERRKAGISPELPRPEEREEIRREHLAKTRSKS